MNRGRAGLVAAGRLALLALIGGCVAANPPPADNRYCAQLFDQLDSYDFLPVPVGPGFDFRQMQIARIQQARCLTFTRELVGLETFSMTLREAPAGPFLRLAQAVQAGIVTSDVDAGRAIAFFNRMGYRARSVGSAGLGTRVYVEARTLGDVEMIVGVARELGFIAPYPSRYVAF